MKNYVIGLLIVALLVTASLYYKERTRHPSRVFPVEESEAQPGVHIHLYFFFSKKSCHDCMQVVETLNHLQPPFTVTGVVPESELQDEAELRKITGVTFPLVSHIKYKRYIPFYSPTIVGTSRKGDIFFILPGVPGTKEYIENFLHGLYHKLLPFLSQEKQYAAAPV